MVARCVDNQGRGKSDWSRGAAVIAMLLAGLGACSDPTASDPSSNTPPLMFTPGTDGTAPTTLAPATPGINPSAPGDTMGSGDSMAQPPAAASPSPGATESGGAASVGASPAPTASDPAVGNAGSTSMDIDPPTNPVGTGGEGNSGMGNAAGADGGSQTPYNPCPPAGTPCTLLPFGDSITDGFNIPGGYRIELFRQAQAAGKRLTFVGSALNGPTQVDGMTFPQNHEGHTGYTIDEAPLVGRAGISPLVPSLAGFGADILLLMIGTNDVDLQVDVANAPARLAGLVDDILARDSRVLLVVAQIIPSQDDALNARTEAYNAAMVDLVNARAAQGQHILLVDMYSAFSSDPAFKTTLLADRLHPTAQGYARIAATWYAAIGALLR